MDVTEHEAAGFLVEKRDQEMILRPVAHIRPDNSDAATRQAFFARYSLLAGRLADPRLQLAYGLHRDTLAKLDSAWLTLGLGAASGG